MNWKEKNLKFSIRKFNIGVASAVIGMSVLGAMAPGDIVTAEETETQVSQKNISYQYVLESELTNEEKALIQSQIPTTVTEETDTYYMVYRPTSALPNTGSTLTNLAALGLGASLFVIGLKNVKGRKRPVITSLMLLTAAGIVGVSSVSAVQGTALATYNQEYTLTVGSELPTTVIKIDNFEFVGYILEGNEGSDASKPSSSSNEKKAEKGVSNQTEPSSTAKNTDATNTEATASDSSQSSANQSDKSDDSAVEEELTSAVQQEEASEQAKPQTSETGSTEDTSAESEIRVSEKVTSEVQYSEVATSEVVTSEDIVSEVVSTVVETSEVTEDGEVITSTDVVSEVITSTVVTSEVVTSTELVSEIVSATSSQVVSEEASATASEKSSEAPTSTVSEETSEETSAVASEEVSEEASAVASEEVSEETSATISEEASEETSAAVSEGASEAPTSAVASEEVSEETSAVASEEVSEETSAVASEQVSEETSATASEKTSEAPTSTVSEEALEETSSTVSEEASEETSSTVSEEASEETSATVSEGASEAPTSTASEEVSEETSETNSEASSEEQSEEDTKSEAVEEVRERRIPYRTIVVEDDTLRLGETVVQVAGVDGLQEMVYVDGKMTKINVIQTSITEVIRIGTKTVTKEGLIEQSNLANSLNESDYSPETWAALQTAIKTAQSILDNESILEQSEIDAATEQLANTIAALAVEKAKLKETIDQAEDLIETDYSAESWKTLLAALPVAVEVYEDEDAVQSLVNQTTESLVNAISQLTVDFTELQAAVQEALSLIESDYSTGSSSELTRALEAAQVLESDEKAKQSAINAAKDDLTTALSNLTTDKTALIAKINEANALNQALYTVKTWSNLQSTLADSTTIKNNQEAKQSEIDIATSILASAIDSLELLQTAPTIVYSDITTDALDKTATITYHVSDPDSTLQSLVLTVYDGDAVVNKLVITNFEDSEITLPYYDTTYSLVTDYTYELNDDEGVKSGDLVAEVLIELKKIEIKDIDDLALYQYDASTGSYNRVPTLDSLPEDVDQYFVRISSDIYKDILLSVASIESVQSEEGYTNYKITTDVDELVQDIDDSDISEYVEQFSFTVAQTPVNEANVYTSFAKLVEAMNANPSGTFTLAANLYADEVDLETATYVTTTFSGTLTGAYNGEQYAIYNLTAPLFATTSSATIEHLDLKNVSIATSDDRAASLAILAYATTIEDVAAQGTVIAANQVGGLTAGAFKTYMNNVSFEGRAVATSRSDLTYLGGISAYLNDSVLTNAYVNADIVSHADSTLSSTNFRIGGIAGHVYNQEGTYKALFGSDYNIENAYVEGNVSLVGTGGNVGGIVGSTYYSNSANTGTLNNVVSAATVSSGNGVYGLVNTVNSINQAYVTDSAMAQTKATVLSDAEVEAVLATMDLTVSLDDSVNDDYSIDYTSLRYALAENETAYNNVAKLIPFYNKEQIVKYGNLVNSDSKLFTTELLSVTPMVDDAIVTDLASNKTAINRIMLYFADDSVDYLNVTYLEDFKNTSISEYSIAGTALIYTPGSFISTYDAVVNAVQAALESVDYNSQAVAEAIGAYSSAEVAELVASGLSEQAAVQQLVEERMSTLGLEDTFTTIQNNIAKELVKVLATSSLINSDGGVVDSYLADYIITNKEKLLLGLAYMTRWYDVNFGDVSLQTLATYYQDFYGKPVNTLEWLVSLADLGYENVKVANNLTTYANSIATNTGYETLLDYLSANRELFTDYETDNDWFKATTSAYIAEVASAELPDESVDVYTKLSYAEQQNGILPLLTAEEGIYIMTNVSTITYGMFASYMDMTLKETDPDAYQKAVEYVQGLIDRAAEAQASHIDAMYRISDESVRQNLIRTIPVWDTYRDAKTGTWLTLSADSDNQAIKDFFEVIDRADTTQYASKAGYSIRHDNAANTRNQSVHYVSAKALDDYGLAVYTHELTHIFDRNTYLNEFTHRSGQGDEDYAQGLFESATKYNDTFFAFNTIQDFTDAADAVTRYTNVSPDRFQSAEDLQEYMHGVMDVIYLLDYAEANSVLAQSDSVVRNWYYQLSNRYDASGNATDLRSNLTEAQAAALNTWEDLVTSNIIDKRYYGLTTSSRYSRNTYYDVALFSSFYAALQNEQGGAAGGLTFRRMAFEFLASAGYDGLVAYTSDQYDNDDDILLAINRLQGTNYSSYTDYKLAMFQERIDQLGQLTSTSINYLGQDIEITSFDQIQTLMTEAVQYDATNNRMVSNSNLSRVYQLKAKLFNAYLRQTDDFSSSIFG